MIIIWKKSNYGNYQAVQKNFTDNYHGFPYTSKRSASINTGIYLKNGYTLKVVAMIDGEAVSVGDSVRLRLTEVP